MSTKTRILLVSDSYYPKFDGPVLVTTEYAKNLMQIPNTEVVVVTAHYPNHTDNQPFPVIRVKSKPIKEGYYAAKPKKDKALREYLDNNKFDLIHCHSPFALCAYFAKYGKKNNIPTVFTFHTKFKEDFQRVLNPIMQKAAMWYIMKNMNACDYALTVSNGAADVLREYGYKRDIRVIRNGTDLKYPIGGTWRVKELQDSVDDKYDLDEEEFVLLSVGRIVANKKLNLALEALKIVSDRGHKFKYIIVGAGPAEHELKELATKLELNGKVIFAGKVMDRELLSAHYLRANLFLFPSTFDTASLAPIEAAASKLPTLMTQGCSTAEIINSGANGLLAPESPEAWAEQIIWAIKNPKDLRKLSENCHTQVFRTWKSVVDEVNDLYSGIIAKNRKAVQVQGGKKENGTVS
jgi:glycosyltransferase involved in cell wall biosynthesis